MKSPLHPLFSNREQLPEPFLTQFFHTPDEPYDVVLEGELDEVWYRPVWLAPLFWFLEAIGILIAERKGGIRTTLRVIADYDQSNQPYQLWFRRFYGSRVKKFDVKVVFDDVTNRAIDLVGPGHLLALGWDIQYEAPDMLRIDVVSAGLHFRGKFLWLPDWLWPLLLGREEFRQRCESEEEGLVSINLLIRHPIFGPIFCYKGRFQLRKAWHTEPQLPSAILEAA